MKTPEELAKEVFNDIHFITIHSLEYHPLYNKIQKSIEIAIIQCASIAENEPDEGCHLAGFRIAGQIQQKILKQVEPKDGNPELDTCITQLKEKKLLIHDFPEDPLPELIRALITISERLNKLEKTE